MALQVAAFHLSQQLAFLVSMVFLQVEIYLNCHVISQIHHHINGSMQICGWELLAVCHQPDKFGGHRHCDSGNVFLIFHVTLRDHTFKEFCEFAGESLSKYVTTFPFLVPICLYIYMNIIYVYKYNVLTFVFVIYHSLHIHI